jgi:cysteinyl-tRNA synthetase
LARDFNTAAALAPLFEWVRQANRVPAPVGDADVREMLSVLGLESLLEVTVPEPPDEVKALSDARERARIERDWAEADRLRERLRSLGWEVRDGPGGPELLPAR